MNGDLNLLSFRITGKSWRNCIFRYFFAGWNFYHTIVCYPSWVYFKEKRYINIDCYYYYSWNFTYITVYITNITICIFTLFSPFVTGLTLSCDLKYEHVYHITMHIVPREHFSKTLKKCFYVTFLERDKS